MNRKAVSFTGVFLLASAGIVTLIVLDLRIGIIPIVLAAIVLARAPL